MDYESAKDTAARLGVTPRAVQKWAKDGKLTGAKRIGREWLIPADAEPARKTESVAKTALEYQLMPVLSSDFEPGHFIEMIGDIADDVDRDIANAEYSYYKGDAEKAVEILEPYLDNEDFAVSLSANFIYTFANLNLGKIYLAKLGLKNTESCVRNALKQENPVIRAYGVLVGNAVAVLLHRDMSDFPKVESVMAVLPEGLRLFGAYLVAHRLCLEKDFSRSVGVAEICLAMKQARYPVASLYLKLMRCVGYMGLKQSKEAKVCFTDINCVALSEKFYQPFVEHHSLLQGIIESELKRNYPVAYSDIVALVQNFSTSWSIVHNEITRNSVTIILTATEFVVAMLFNRGWSVKEISAHMDVSPRMVKHHLSVTYEKLGVSNREELGAFLLK